MVTLGVLLTTVLGVSRLSFAMTRNADLPRFLKETHPKYNVDCSNSNIGRDNLLHYLEKSIITLEM
ncbi:MAG: hypothetical protein ACUVWK_06180 [Nitrososphaerales archaeon]